MCAGNPRSDTEGLINDKLHKLAGEQWYPKPRNLVSYLVGLYDMVATVDTFTHMLDYRAAERADIQDEQVG